LSWTTWLSFLAFPIFLAGFIKNGERVWALYSSATAHISLSTTNQLEDDQENPCAKKLILARQSFAIFKPYIVNTSLLQTTISRIPGKDLRGVFKNRF
jgi:hypothetical protein